MPKKKKPVSCLADLMADEIDEFNDMLDEGFIDIDDEFNADIDKEWKQALKDLKELGFMEDDK